MAKRTIKSDTTMSLRRDCYELLVQHAKGKSFWLTDTGDQPILDND